eukprot:g23767.t1
MRALLQPCNTDEAQLWIYNETSGQLKDRNGYCLEATAVPMLGQAIGTPVNVGLCDVALSIQQWEYFATTKQVKLKETEFCLDAAQPDTVGGRVQVFACHIGNGNQVWTFSEHFPYADSEDTGQCLSMHQPWASLLVYGFKRAEGRSWKSDHRGRLWIHATAKAPDPAEIQALEERYSFIYEAAGVPIPSLPSKSGGYPTSARDPNGDVGTERPKPSWRRKNDVVGTLAMGFGA